MTVREFAQYVGRDIRTVQRWYLQGVKGRRLQVRWIGGRIDITDAHVAEFLGERPKRQRRTPERAAHHGLI